MNKKLKALLASINAKKTEVINLTDEGKLEEAKAAKAELVELQGKFDILSDMMDQVEVVDAIEITPAQETPVDSVAEFANAARGLFRNMSEGTGADGGYTVPADIQTQIRELREAGMDLSQYVSVEGVTTLSGSRTYKTRSTQTGFVKVGEGGKIGKKAGPAFKRVDYSVDKYAGYYPVTNELLEDSDANITGTLTQWIGNESRITRNTLILTAVATNTQKDLEDLDGIKGALNKDLGAKFKATSAILTNDDGIDYLDTLKDANGRYMLGADPTAPGKMQLKVGANVVPVINVPNEDLATKTNKVPFIIGDLKEGIVLFDRKHITIMASNTASTTDYSAFEEDMTLFRAIERLDVKVKDDKAFINGYITVV